MQPETPKPWHRWIPWYGWVLALICLPGLPGMLVSGAGIRIWTVRPPYNNPIIAVVLVLLGVWINEQLWWPVWAYLFESAGLW